MVAIKCQRCSRITWTAVVCNYCGKVVCDKCVKTSKRVKRRDIAKLHICKDCWSNLEKRKMYRNNVPLIISEFVVPKG